MCRSPKNDWFQPVNGNQAIGAGTPMLMPIMPALKWCLNWRGAYAAFVQSVAAVYYLQSFSKAGGSLRGFGPATAEDGAEVSFFGPPLGGLALVQIYGPH